MSETEPPTTAGGRKQRRNKQTVEVLQTDLQISGDQSGYDPYDNPGASKPSPDDGELPQWRRLQRGKITRR